jgi:hypothetical protein
MGELLLTELTICAAVIVVAAAAMVMLRLQGRDQSRMPVAGRCGTVAELFDRRTPEPEAAALPGLSHDAAERDPGTSVPAGPGQAAVTPVSEVAAAVTFSEQIDGYYEAAERHMADYLAARGWTEEQGQPGQPADADAAPASPQAAAEPAASRQLAA